MHKEAKEELRVRLKLAVIEFADQLGVTKACQEFNVPRANLYRWKQKYEKGLSPTAILAERHLKLWRRSWQSGRSINWEPYELSIIWTAIMGSGSQSP